MKNETRARLDRIQKSLRLTGVIVALSVGVILPVLLSTSVGIIAVVAGEGSLSLVVGVLVISFTSAAIGVAIVIMVVLGKRARTARLQADLLANVTHELRTPLSAIKMYAQTMEMGLDNLSREEQLQCIDTIIREADWLNVMIDRVLTWRSLAKDRCDLELLEQSVREAVESTAEHFRKMILSENMKFEVSVNTDRPVTYDTRAMSSVILNLLVNAYKYTNEGKYIQLQAYDQDQHVVIQVSDNGIGIPKKEMKRITEPFYRVDSGLRGKAPGAGLGLAIVSHLVKAHNGAMIIESKEGEGSTFKILLPVVDNLYQGKI